MKIDNTLSHFTAIIAETKKNAISKFILLLVKHFSTLDSNSHLKFFGHLIHILYWRTENSNCTANINQ